MYYQKDSLIDHLSFRISQDIRGWDLELLRYEFAHPFQSASFSIYFQQKGYKQIHIRILYGVTLVGQCSVSVLNNKIALWHYGPLVKKEFCNNYLDIAEGLKRYLLQQGVVCFDNPTTQIFYNQDFIEDEEYRSYRLCETVFVDLRKDLKEINDSFDYSVRKNIKKCDKAGVEVIITDEDWAIKLYLEMLYYNRKRLGLKLPPFYPEPNIMKSVLSRYASIHIALARLGQSYLAGLGFFKFGKVVVEIGAAQSELYLKHKFPAHDLIKVKAIEEYKKQGVSIYDLSGIGKDGGNQKENNIRRFKMKFSSDIAVYAILLNKGAAYLHYLKYKALSRIKQFSLFNYGS